MGTTDRHRAHLRPALRVALPHPVARQARHRRAQRARARHRGRHRRPHRHGLPARVRAGAQPDRPDRVRAHESCCSATTTRATSATSTSRSCSARAASSSCTRRRAHARLDSSEPDLDTGRVGRERYRWIEERFADDATSSRCVAHAPPPRARARAPGASATSSTTRATCCACWPTAGSTSCCAATSTCRTSGGSRTCSSSTRARAARTGCAAGSGPATTSSRSTSSSHVRVLLKEPYVDAEVVADFRDVNTRYCRWRPARGPPATGDVLDGGAQPMSRVVALIDGEHYPPVVRFALDRARGASTRWSAAAFVGGTEKVDLDRGLDDLRRAGRDRGRRPRTRCARRSSATRPTRVVDLSDEPVLSAADRFRLASVALVARRRVPRRGLRVHAAARRVVTPHADARHHRDRQARGQDRGLGLRRPAAQGRRARHRRARDGPRRPARARAHPRRAGRADHAGPARARARRASTRRATTTRTR